MLKVSETVVAGQQCQTLNKTAIRVLIVAISFHNLCLLSNLALSVVAADDERPKEARNVRRDRLPPICIICKNESGHEKVELSR